MGGFMANNFIYERLLKFQSYYSFLGKEFVDDIILNDKSLSFSSKQECYKTSLKMLKMAIKDEINRQYQSDPNKLFSNLLVCLSQKGNFEDLEKIKVLQSVIKAISSEIPVDIYEFLINDSSLKSILNKLFDSSSEPDKLYYDYPGLKNLFDKYLSLSVSYDSNDDFNKERTLLSYEEVKDLYQRIASGDNSAKEILINKNLRLVKKIAAYILKSREVYSFTFDDLCQEGVIGLMRAIDRYDPTKGFQFSTYATFWIRQRIFRAIDDYDRTIRLPVGYGREFSKIGKKIDDLEIKLGRNATYDEIKSELNLSSALLRRYYDTPVKLSSLNKILKEDEGDELGEFVVAEEVFGNSPDDRLNREAFINFLRANLKVKEFDIITRRFGLADEECNTLQMVSRDYNITGERIRQIQKKAISKLSSNPIFVEFLIEDNQLLLFNKLKEVCDGKLLAYISYRTGLIGGTVKTPNELESIFKREKIPVLEKDAEKVLRKKSEFLNLYIRYSKFYGKSSDEVVKLFRESRSNSKNELKKVNNFDYTFNDDVFSSDILTAESDSSNDKSSCCLLTDDVLISIKPYLVQIRDTLTELIPLVNEENCEFLLGEVKKLTMVSSKNNFKL